jgi:hypothetical protein
VKKLVAMLMMAASVTAGHAEVQATPELIAALNKRFPGIEQDNVWMEMGGGVNVKCRGCHTVWFEASNGNWVCNFKFGPPVKIKNCWNRHA